MGKYLGDMPSSEFRKYGHEVIERMADYLDNIEKLPVLSQVKPGYLKELIETKPPIHGESLDKAINDLDSLIIPGLTHWNHPGFHAYFNSTSSGPGILGELIAATFNANGMLWKTSPAATELEEITVNWVRQMIGLPEKFWGIIYDGASSGVFHAIAAAREQANPQIRKNGLQAESAKPLRMYCSEHTHSSVDKAVIALGLGLNGLKKIRTDDQFRMNPDELKKEIVKDKEAGFQPFCVVATVGTTSFTSIDPVEEIARICKEEGMWLHVDASYGGCAAIVPEMRHVLKGCEEADSLIMNPHKWMFTPVDVSILFTPKRDILKQAFSLVPEYLKTQTEGEVTNYMDYGIALGRRFRSLKLWLVIRHFGEEGLAERLRENIRLGGVFKSLVENSDNFELMAPVPFSVVCFRAIPVGYSEEELNILNQSLMDAVNADGRIFISHTKIKDKLVLRFVAANLRMEERHVRSAWEIFNEKLENLLKK